ncbi:glycosyltransferase family 4 protein [Agromyces marinus]|uniref:Glycosyl transferase n=1 Tax=Agromyces marinus TaxID=1389020 RepID=A0ABN6YCH7_9MICO|nr:glycosyltransferase family 4 protein [Agromyces marinus]UIP59981.1 D-inositol-3-phosphate glycosyltransferase [Agromyces marinus]BDZ54913.1 glycosyl transferase [Agromyces marinus]
MIGQERRLRVLHLDHTDAAGGAELALIRMLQVRPDWAAALQTPPLGPGPNVWDAVPPRVARRVAGIRQPAGASSGGALAALGFGVRLAVQAVATRTSAAFRSADLVDANTARAAAYGALAARVSRTPFVVHLRDLVEPEALGGAGHALMTRVVLPRADGVIANSRATLDSAQPYLRPEAIAEVVPSASGLTVGAALLVRADTPLKTIGMLARIDPWKGQAELLEAFARVFAGRDIRLQFAGGAPFGHEGYLAELQRRADGLGVGSQVDVLGHVDEVPRLLDGWEVGVQYSTRPEPLGQNVLQYLAAGRVVVAADEGGPAEWVSDGVNGLLVPPRDVDALAGVLRRLDRDSALRAHLSGAAAATPGLLDDAAVARAHLAVYERVLAARD